MVSMKWIDPRPTIKEAIENVSHNMRLYNDGRPTVEQIDRNLRRAFNRNA